MVLWYRKLKDKIWSNRIFFLFVFCLFLLILIFDSNRIRPILIYFWKNLQSLAPILLIVYIIIFIFSILIANKKITSFLDSGHYIKKMSLAIVGWILSSGPIYLRYWFLKKLHKSWLTLWHIAWFSYSRAIKIPLIPMMIIYFGVKFSLVFVAILLLLSFLQCLVIDKIIKL